MQLVEKGELKVFNEGQYPKNTKNGYTKRMPRTPLVVIALFFITGGAAHFFVAEFFIMAMPDYLGYHKELVAISGLFEILGAIGILVPQTRLLAGYGLIALIIAVYPANINMALHPKEFTEIAEFLLYIRLTFQILFIWFVWWAITPERLKKSRSTHRKTKESKIRH
jgi:uncharacterized membrane protein